MSRACTGTPVRPTSDADADAFEAARELLLRELYYEPLVAVEPTHPLRAYKLLYGETPALATQRRVRALYERWPRPPKRGGIYAYRDARDGDVLLFKLGSSKHVERRLDQWRALLGAGREHFTSFYVDDCADCALAEAIVHELLACERQRRELVATGALLTEYFRVTSIEALRLLMASVVRHVNYRAWRRDARAAYTQHRPPLRRTMSDPQLKY